MINIEIIKLKRICLCVIRTQFNQYVFKKSQKVTDNNNQRHL